MRSSGSTSKSSVSRRFAKSIHAPKHDAQFLVQFSDFRLREGKVKTLVKLSRNAVLLIVLANSAQWIHAQVAVGNTLLDGPTTRLTGSPSHAQRVIGVP